MYLHQLKAGNFNFFKPLYQHLIWEIFMMRLDSETQGKWTLRNSKL